MNCRASRRVGRRLHGARRRRLPLATPQPTNNGAMVAMLVSFVPVVAGHAVAESLLRDDVRTPGVEPPRKLAAVLLVVLHRGGLVPERRDSRRFRAGAPTLSFVGLVSLWVAIRDWPWRAYYLGATAAVAIGFAASAPVGGLLAPDMTLGVMFILLGVSMVPIGLLDHLLLVKLMKEVREQELHRAL